MAASSGNELTDLLREAQAGSDEAAQLLFERWRRPVLNVIRRRLSQPLRRLYDSDDFLQAAFAQLLMSEFDEATTPQAFCAWVLKIAHNKVVDAERKYLQSARHGIRHDVPIDDAEEPCAPVAPEPSREDGEARRDFIEHLPAPHRQVIELYLAGKKPKQIALSLGKSQKDIYRLIDEVRRAWRQRRMDGWMDGWMDDRRRGYRVLSVGGLMQY